MKITKCINDWCNLGLKSWAFVKLCQKTGMNPIELNIWKDAVKCYSYIIGLRFKFFLLKKFGKKPVKPKVKPIPLLPAPKLKNPTKVTNANHEIFRFYLNMKI